MSCTPSHGWRVEMVILATNPEAPAGSSATLSAAVEFVVKSGDCKSIRVFVGKDCRVPTFEFMKIISDVARRFWGCSSVRLEVGPERFDGTMGLDVMPGSIY